MGKAATRYKAVKHYERGIYKAFFFRDHHPVLDAIDRVYELTGALDPRGVPRFAAISEVSGVSETAIRKWRSRETKRPQDASVEAVLRGLGAERVIQCQGVVIRYGDKVKAKRPAAGAEVIDLSKRRRAAKAA